MHLIIGLGNPGKQYEMTRHNTGFRVIDRLSKDLGIQVSKGHCQALIGQGEIKSAKVMLAKPQTLMNLSGNSVLELVNWYKIENDRLIVIHDDLDLDTGRIKIMQKGNSAGHKGVESIIAATKTTSFARIRIGIGRPASPAGRESLGGDNSNYVLANFAGEQLEAMNTAIILASEAATFIVSDGIEAAMNKYNIS